MPQARTPPCPPIRKGAGKAKPKANDEQWKYLVLGALDSEQELTAALTGGRSGIRGEWLERARGPERVDEGCPR